MIVERGVEEKNMNDSSGENWKIQVDDSHSGSPLFHSHYEENFTPLELLGSGAYGIVFKAQNKTDKSIYALKRINLPTKYGFLFYNVFNNSKINNIDVDGNISYNY